MYTWQKKKKQLNKFQTITSNHGCDPTSTVLDQDIDPLWPIPTASSDLPNYLCTHIYLCANCTGHPRRILDDSAFHQQQCLMVKVYIITYECFWMVVTTTLPKIIFVFVDPVQKVKDFQRERSSKPT